MGEAVKMILDGGLEGFIRKMNYAKDQAQSILREVEFWNDFIEANPDGK